MRVLPLLSVLLCGCGTGAQVTPVPAGPGAEAPPAAFAVAEPETVIFRPDDPLVIRIAHLFRIVPEALDYWFDPTPKQVAITRGDGDTVFLEFKGTWPIYRMADGQMWNEQWPWYFWAMQSDEIRQEAMDCATAPIREGN